MGALDLAKLLTKPTPARDFIRAITVLCQENGWPAPHSFKAAFPIPAWEAKYRCPHGAEGDWSISAALVSSVANPEDLAAAVWPQMVGWCKKHHGPPKPETVDYVADLVNAQQITTPVAEVKISIDDMLSKAYAKAWGQAQKQFVNQILYGSAAQSSSPVVDDLAKLVPALATEKATCPGCGDGCACGCGMKAIDTGFSVSDRPVAEVIMHLNDQHRWTREQIADWLETLPIDLTIQAASTGD